MCTCTGVTGSPKGATELEIELSTYLQAGSSRGISRDGGMVEISMLFQVFFSMKCTRLVLNTCNTLSLSDGRLAIDKH